jgi:hypothetical protein
MEMATTTVVVQAPKEPDVESVTLTLDLREAKALLHLLQNLHRGAVSALAGRTGVALNSIETSMRTELDSVGVTLPPFDVLLDISSAS